jgi:hypothetical protein
VQAEAAAEAREAGRQRVDGGAGIGPRRRVAHPCHRQCEGGRRKELVVEEPTAQGRAGQGSMRALRARPNPLSGGSHGLGVEERFPL